MSCEKPTPTPEDFKQILGVYKKKDYNGILTPKQIAIEIFCSFDDELELTPIQRRHLAIREINTILNVIKYHGNDIGAKYCLSDYINAIEYLKENI